MQTGQGVEDHELELIEPSENFDDQYLYKGNQQDTQLTQGNFIT